jgi:hypothetical protein
LLRREIESRLEKTTTMRIIYNDFVPYEEMDMSYFLDE